MSTRERRENHRLTIALPFIWRPCEADEKPRLLPPVGSGPGPLHMWLADVRPGSPPPASDTPEISYHRRLENYLEVLERKVDLLTNMIQLREYRDFFSAPPTTIELSASGLCFPAATPLPPRALVAMAFFLPHLAVLVQNTARILRVSPRQPPAGDYRVAARFEGMKPATADRIARFVIIMERYRLGASRLEDAEEV
ncbi:MAG: hypothetical protein JW781_07570 [Deltaproteobacteria bacterium]|nr:hypothetical protein [Candidatus Anaeroferrophillacea bacterium]